MSMVMITGLLLVIRAEIGSPGRLQVLLPVTLLFLFRQVLCTGQVDFSLADFALKYDWTSCLKMYSVYLKKECLVFSCLHVPSALCTITCRSSLTQVVIVQHNCTLLILYQAFGEHNIMHLL